MTPAPLTPLAADALDPADRERVARAAEFMGFDANDVRTMARVPGLLAATAALVDACYRPGRVTIELKRLTAYLTSRSAGCGYCEAHTQFGALRHGIDADRLGAVWTFESDGRFTPAEKAVFRLAVAAGTGGPTDLADVRQYFDEDQTAEILAVLALFAFLNRWNLVAATTLETVPQRSLATTQGPAGPTE